MQRAGDAIKNALIGALLEFLEAAVHTVLKARNVYSSQLFENRRLYGISVSQCRHPDVCLYIGTVLGNLKPLLLKDTLQELVVCFFDQQGKPTSKVSFIIQGFNSTAEPVDWAALEPAFRSALLKLHFSDNLLRPLPDGSTFELLAVATSRAGVNPQVFTEEAGVQAVTLQQPATGLPVNACNLPGILSMQIVLEEEPEAALAAAGEATLVSSGALAGTSAAAAAAGGGSTGRGLEASQPGDSIHNSPQLQLQLGASPAQLLSQGTSSDEDQGL